MKNQDIIEYYAALSYEKQKRLLVALQAENKKPPYYISFKLDTTGLNKLGKITEYCKKNNIEFTAEKAGNMAVKYRFDGISDRNAVLFGNLAMKKENT